MRLARRGFLRNTLVAAIVTATGFSVQGSNNGVITAYKPGHKKFIYKARTIEVDETEQRVMITINSEHMHHIKKIQPPGSPPFYTSHLLPFQRFSSVEEMIGALVDQADEGAFILTR
jgi:hypothetical protein